MTENDDVLFLIDQKNGFQKSDFFYRFVRNRFPMIKILDIIGQLY
jgi:hypothetical protein